MSSPTRNLLLNSSFCIKNLLGNLAMSLRIRHKALELSSWNLLQEKLINLFVSTATGFGLIKPDENETQHG